MSQQIHQRRHFIEALYDNPVGRVATAGALALMIAAATVPRLLPRSNSIEFPNLPSIGRSVDTQSQGTGQTSTGSSDKTVTDVYYTQTRSYLTQELPEISNYTSALNYATQRIVDFKNAQDEARKRGASNGHGIITDFDRLKTSVVKWTKANIEWDKKGERLVPFSEYTDFLPDALFNNYSSVNRDHEDLTLKANDALEKHIAEMVTQHDQIWAELQDPAKMREYLDQADIVNIWWTEQEAAKYKSAIRQQGTFADKAHWALVGRAWTYPKGNEEIARNEQPLAYVLAVGGQAQIAYNVNDLSRGDRQLAIRISRQLEDEFANDPGYYGQPIDHGYLQPNLPNRQAVDALEQVSGGKLSPSPLRKTVLVFREDPLSTNKDRRTYLVGDAEIARKLAY
ncbi:MAG: hypothetical protein HYT71_02210 [Candidatus Aenigmarchaeota archaeon]|nr:hypothetical protein [Candidatus Aenigmarchaeota archaeon]